MAEHLSLNNKHRRKINLNLVSRTVGQGPHVVLLHGWGLNSGVWQPMIDSLQAHICFTTIDLPGFGLNHAVVPEDYDLFSLASGVAKQIPEDANLVGWSLGGLVAQKIALLVPQKIKRLILVASSPKFTCDGQWPGIKSLVLENFEAQLAQNLSATISRFLAIQAMGSPTAKQDIKVIRQQIDCYPQAAQYALTQGLLLLANSDLRADLIKLTMPVDFLLGRLDSLVPVKLKEQLAMLNSAIRTTVFEHSSHAPFISELEYFNEKLIQIVNS